MYRGGIGVPAPHILENLDMGDGVGWSLSVGNPFHSFTQSFLVGGVGGGGGAVGGGGG